MNACSFKAGASELISIFPLVRYFAQRIVAPTNRIPSQLQSFLACCKLVDVMLQAKYQGADPSLAQGFDDAACEFLRLHTLAYDTEHVKPKHHFMMHVGRQWAEDGFALDCFVQERKHQVIKDCASHIKNTSVFERSVLAAVVNSMTYQRDEVAQLSKQGLRQIYEGLQD